MAGEAAVVAEASHPSGPGTRYGQGLLESAGDLALLFFRTLGDLARGRVLPGETLRQMSQIGVSSLPITLLIMSFSGMVLALHTANQLKRLGLEGLIGGIVAVSAAREAAPVLTAVAVAARVGSSIAAEIGTMAVTEQVDALRALGVSPVRYLVVPRFLAAVVMLPILTIFANAAALLGGLFVTVFGAGVSAPIYLNSASDLLQPADLFLGLLKTFVFGAIIALVGCSHGLRTTGGAAGVGRSTTAAVVTSIVLVYVADYFLAEGMFSGSPVLYQ
jgi:phospholipid/cholesterol/gamma-HCH transport system permease protein